MRITLVNAGSEYTIDVPSGRDVGSVRELSEDLAEIGAPSSYTFGVNGQGVPDTHMLSDGDRVSFRPVVGDKG